MHVYQLLPYVLSTSFSTHPKPLTRDKKPFQSRRVHFFWHYETFPLFSALWDYLTFSRNFFIVPVINFDFLQQNGCSKNPKGSPLSHFLALCDLLETSKKSKKNSELFSQFLVFWELLLSPVVEKVVFESFWALDMASTWAVPGVFGVMVSPIFGAFSVFHSFWTTIGS